MTGDGPLTGCLKFLEHIARTSGITKDLLFGTVMAKGAVEDPKPECLTT